MIPHKKNTQQIGFFSSFEDTLNPKHPLFVLANKMDWSVFEKAFCPYTHRTMEDLPSPFD